jgi:hypothetical protein
VQNEEDYQSNVDKDNLTSISRAAMSGASKSIINSLKAQLDEKEGSGVTLG